MDRHREHGHGPRGQVAVRLRDGRVLVAGGANKLCYCAGIVYYASAELYDPASGTWMATGSKLEPQLLSFTLSQLVDGRVLAAGEGVSELYDPGLGTWTVSGKMVTSDAAVNATLLPDGRVLVAGGGGGGSVTCDGCAPRSSAQLYNPASGTWAAAANMTRPRSAPTVTLLPDGKVLVAGGDPPTDQPGPYGPSTAELYDPVIGTWTATGNMVTPASVRLATLLPDGQVLVVGLTASNALSAELYDPASGTWALTGKMVADHGYYAAALLLNGKVLVTGNSGAGQLYDPASGTWTSTGSLPPPVRSAMPYTATLLSDGRVLVAGGALPAATAGSAFTAISAAELYDPGSP